MINIYVGFWKKKNKIITKNKVYNIFFDKEKIIHNFKYEFIPDDIYILLSVVDKNGSITSFCAGTYPDIGNINGNEIYISTATLWTERKIKNRLDDSENS